MISLKINGQKYEVDVRPDMELLWVIREHLRLTGTKYGCGIGECGGCTVHIDGKPELACQTTLEKVAGQEITTIEGLTDQHPIKRAWIEEQVPQCGYCMPGQMMQAASLLADDPRPSEEKIVDSMSNVLCRCGSYLRIKKGVDRAARIIKEEGGMS